jgi:hypothetical protein
VLDVAQSVWLAMKRVKVSAFPERGLRPDGCREAEPQVWPIKNSNLEKKADTMKTYILRDPQAVEPQKPSPPWPPSSGT